MKYTVVWKPEAERRLADIWVDAADRPAVTKAANYIDKVLRFDPEEVGESRAEGRRVLLTEVLGVIFKIQSQDRLVSVLTVWRIRRRGPVS